MTADTGNYQYNTDPSIHDISTYRKINRRQIDSAQLFSALSRSVSQTMKPKNKKAQSEKFDKSKNVYEILPYLFLGPRSGTIPSTAKAFDITHIISIGCDPDNSVPRSATISYHRIGLRDYIDSDMRKPADLVAEIIRNAKTKEVKSEDGQEQPAKIFVHCVAGISRSPSMIADYLMTEEGMTLKEALALLVTKKPNVNPNVGFFQQLKEREMALHGKASLPETMEGLPGPLTRKKVVLGIEA